MDWFGDINIKKSVTCTPISLQYLKYLFFPQVPLLPVISSRILSLPFFLDSFRSAVTNVTAVQVNNGGSLLCYGT